MQTIKKDTYKHHNTGYGPVFQTIDIGHKDYLALVEPDTAFWLLVKKNKLGNLISDKKFIEYFKEKSSSLKKDINALRFEIKPSAVYLNPTEKCNFNCTYCYIPEEMRKNGSEMSSGKMLECFKILKGYFEKILPAGRKAQIIFHGSEPMMNREAMFNAIEKYSDSFEFGVQTNASMLDDSAISFLRSHEVGIGISIDGPSSESADKNRRNWNGEGFFDKITPLLAKLNDYSKFNVICTITADNMEYLSETVDFFHENKVRVCMLNILRCTQERSRKVKPDEEKAAKHYIAALERTHELYKKTGRKIIVANFANILIALMAPGARKLMCDISPCGGGRCFFSVSANGDIFPCSEFVGVPEYKGGNIYSDAIDSVLNSAVFRSMTGRMVENIYPCKTCAIRHFCGSPCPAEAHTMNGGMDRPGAFCAFYEAQVRYALRLIADKRESDFLWEKWDAGTETLFDAETLDFA